MNKPEREYEARITYFDAQGVRSVEYVADDDQDMFYAVFAGAVCGITGANGVVVNAEVVRTPFMPAVSLGGSEL